MKRIKIFLTSDDSYTDSANKIKKESEFDIELIYTESFLKKKAFDIINKDILYFFGNDPLAYKAIQKISNTKCYIYNKSFFLKKYTKLEIQDSLRRNKLDVPKQIKFSELKNEEFPIFCKENKHAGIVFQAYKKTTLDIFFEKFNKKSFYIEMPIGNEAEEKKELKIYFVKDNIFTHDNSLEIINNDLKRICHKISNIFDNLETFSVDFIKTKNKYYIIDVNVATGFFLSDKARKALIHDMDSR